MKNSKSVGSSYTKEQKEKFSFLIKKMKEERESLEQAMPMHQEVYDDHYYNGTPEDYNLFYGIELRSLRENEKSKLFYFLDALKQYPNRSKIYAEFLEEQAKYWSYGTTPPVSEAYKQILEHFKSTQTVVEDEKLLRELLR